MILSPDALLIRLTDADLWTILVWRGLLFALGVTLVIFFIYGRKTIRQFYLIGKTGVQLGLLFGLSTISFVIAIQYTSIANALVIISASPVFAALLSWLFLKEKTPLRTWITITIIIIAMIMIMLDSYQSGGLLGGVSALITSILLAINFTIIRSKKDTNMVPAMAVSGIATSCIAAIVIAFSTTIPFYLESNSVPYLLAMGFVVTLAFSLIMLGPRYIPAAEVSMIMPLETVFGSYLAWFFINETPSTYVIVGGLIILLTLMFHAWYSQKKQNRTQSNDNIQNKIDY